MKRYRVAILTSSFPPQSGGIAAAHFQLFHRLRDRHHVRAFTFRDPTKNRCDDVEHSSGGWLKAVFRILLRRALRRPVGERGLTHCDAIADTAAEIMSLNRSIEKFRPDFVLCPDHYLPSLTLRKPKGSFLIWMAHNNYYRFVDQPLVPPVNFDDLLLAHRLERRAASKADAVVSPSHYMLRVFDETLKRDIPRRVAKNFVDFRQLARIKASPLRQQLGLGERSNLIYVPSGGSAMKGCRHLAEIARFFARTSTAENPTGLYVSGHVRSDVRFELERLCPLVRCWLPGAVEYEQNLCNVAACDITISPTLIENLSTALVESITLGVPVITFDTGGNREIILDGLTGVVVPYADVSALVHTASCLTADSEALRRLRSGCALNAGRIVDPCEIQGAYESLFDELACQVRS